MTRPASTRSGLRRWLLRGSLTLGASLLVVVCLEGALRVVSAPVLADSDEGPLVNEFTQTLPGVKSNVRYERNRFGLRALTMDAREKPPRTVRILCLGASTTDQAPQATADTWCGLLETSLQPAMAARGLRIETAGHGRPGHGAADVTRWARANVPLLQPDLVITLLGINDLAFAAAPKSFGKELERGIGAAARPAEAGPDRPSLRERCRQMSQLCQRLAVAAARAQQLWQVATGRALEWHSSQLPALQSRYQGYPDVNEVPREPDPLPRFAESVGGLLEFLRSADVPALVLGQPVLWEAEMSADERARLWFPIFTPAGPVRPSGAWLAGEMQRFNRAQQHQAEALGATYFDLDGRIPKTLEFFFDDCHYTDAGSRRLAEEILPQVTALLNGANRRSPTGSRLRTS